MVARFRSFHKEICAAPETVDAIIKATTCLHNYIKHQRAVASMYCGQCYVDNECTNGVVIPGQWRREVQLNSNALGTSLLRFGNRNYSREAFNYRDYLKNYFNNTGQVGWQLDYIRRTV